MELFPSHTAMLRQGTCSARCRAGVLGIDATDHTQSATGFELPQQTSGRGTFAPCSMVLLLYCGVVILLVQSHSFTTTTV